MHVIKTNTSSKEVLQPVDKEENKILVMTFHFATENWSKALVSILNTLLPRRLSTPSTDIMGRGASSRQRRALNQQSAEAALQALQSQQDPPRAPDHCSAYCCPDCHRLLRSGSEHYTVASSSQQLKLIWRKYCAL